jgi:anti-sigma regulatory factor (Ser/Thr protein kinase)/CheY-like chemotaxis protein
MASPSPRKTALVVDSGSEINGVLDGVLKSEGWGIQRVPDNQAVLALVTATTFDLIITSAKTRGPEDIALLSKIRSVRPHARLIILTDKWTPGDVIAAVREGAFSYFSGPFQHSALVEMVRTAMASPCWDDGIEVLSATTNGISLTARCDFETADRLVQFLRGARLPDFSEADREGIIFAFKEILLNAMEHGCNFDSSQHVEISFMRDHGAVVCRVKDPGEGFSLEEVRHAAINNPASDLARHARIREEQGLRPGGFGILIAKKLVDEVVYSQKGNEVFLVKHVRPDTTQAGSDSAANLGGSPHST